MTTSKNAMDARPDRSTVAAHVYEHLPLIFLVGSFVSFFAVATYVLV